MFRFFVGLDLGMMFDFTAIAMLQRIIKPARDCYVSEYHLVHLERLPLQTQYPSVVKHLETMFENPELRDEGRLIVDATGVGMPVIQMIRGAGMWPIPITITGGAEVVEKDNGFHVPKRHLVSALMVLFQSGRLKIASDLQEGRTLAEELQNFQYKLDKRTGHDTYEAMKEGVHDDLVLSVSLAAWYATKDEATQSFFTDSRPWEKDEEANQWDPLGRD